MSVPLKAIIAAVAVFSAVSAQAQLLGPGWEVNIELNQNDLDLIHATVDQRVHGKLVGTVAYWRNPASGNSGSIKLEKKFTVRNQKCEEIEYILHTRKPGTHSEHYHFTSCLQPYGKWKIIG